MISYYELLGMIKEGNIPNKIKVHLTPCTSKIYVKESDIDESLIYYRIDEMEEEDENYKDYLAVCYLESSMFDETIEILDEKKIGKLGYIVNDEDGDFTIDGYAMDYEQKIEIIKKINEIIDKINKEE